MESPTRPMDASGSTPTASVTGSNSPLCNVHRKKCKVSPIITDESPINSQMVKETVKHGNEDSIMENDGDNGKERLKSNFEGIKDVIKDVKETPRNLSSSTLSSKVDYEESNAQVTKESRSSPLSTVEEETDTWEQPKKCRDGQNVAISQDPNGCKHSNGSCSNMQPVSESSAVADSSISSDNFKSDRGLFETKRNPVSKGGQDTGGIGLKILGNKKDEIADGKHDHNNAFTANDKGINTKSTVVVETSEKRLDAQCAVASRIKDLEVVKELILVTKNVNRDRRVAQRNETLWNEDRLDTNRIQEKQKNIMSKKNKGLYSIPPGQKTFSNTSVHNNRWQGSKIIQEEGNEKEESNLCIDSTMKIRSKEESSECFMGGNRVDKDRHIKNSDKVARTRARLEKTRTCTQSSSRKRNRLETRVLEVERVVSDDYFFGGLRNSQKAVSQRRLRSEARVEIEFNKSQKILFELIRNIKNKIGLFSYPVDPGDDECLDYFEVIDEDSEAMDFQTMNDFVKNGKITTIDDIERYLKQIADSSIKYHQGTDNFIYKKARQIESLAAPIIEKARIKWEKSITLRKPQNSYSTKNRLRKRRPPSAESKGMNTSNSDEDENVQESTRYREKKANIPIEKSSRVLRNRCVEYAGIDFKGAGGEESSCDERSFNDENAEKKSKSNGSEIPFVERNYESKSYVTTCTSREEWLRLCPAITTVCNEAARRSTLKENPLALIYEKPLSEVYMSERLEYDNPLNGLLMRTQAEPNHIQGFIVTTNFTTWRKTFRWTTDNPASLVTPTDHRLRSTDRDGALTMELQNVERMGLDSRTGYTYPRVCEISLLGGLRCGGLLLSRALADLQVAGKYDYVVLQSTKMAIPFYERYGFVRVGAVTRLNDNEGLPEVAYRHWSEMVDGKTVEASYMMARKLDCKVPFKLKDNRSPKTITVTERNIEIESALRSTSCLLFEALSVRATSSAVCMNSFRELVIAAREFARSAEDYHVIEAINKALSSLTETKIGSSKTVLRHELELSKAKLSAYASSKKIKFKKNRGASGFEGEQVIVNEIDCRSDDQVTVIITSTEKPISSELDSKLTAVLPDKNLLHDRSGKPQVHVNVTIGGEQFSDEPTEYNEANVCNKLTTFLDIGEGRTNAHEVHEASLIAIENLRSMFYEGCPMLADQLEISHAHIRSTTMYEGDEIMIRVQAFDGNPLWVSGVVAKREKKKDTFIIEWEEPEGDRSITKTLSPNNRGVGRNWCTPLDWYSFPLLPMQILDTLLVGSSVLYPDRNANVVSGTITKKVGGGIASYPTWRLVTHSGESKDLLPGALREAVHIDDYKIAQSIPVLNSFPCLYDKKRQTSRKKHKSQQTELSREDLVILWAKSRFEEISSYPAGVMEEKRKRIREEKDDEIITLKTGVEQNVSDTNQKKKDAQKSKKRKEPKKNYHHDMVGKKTDSDDFSARALRPRNDSSNKDFGDIGDGIGSRLRKHQRRG